MSAVALVLTPQEKDLGGGFRVRRLVPQAARRAVGPFVFCDHMGPVAFAAGAGLDVRPHPHIGLATVTYLFEGQIVHRDSLGTTQPIDAGAVNWMVAGSGIVHSERTAPDRRRDGERLHGIQTWVALPRDAAECAPSFTHHAAASLPRFSLGDARVTVIAGDLAGRRAPVAVASPTLYAAAAFAGAGSLELPCDHAERAVYVVEGEVAVDGDALPPCHAAMLAPEQVVRLSANGPATLMLFGGAPLDGPRMVWWNFVSHSRERIEQAKADWRAQRMGRVPDELEFIPLPE